MQEMNSGEALFLFIFMTVFFLYPTWRIFKRAGLNPLGSLWIVIPGLGIYIAGLILALSNWKLNKNSIKVVNDER